MTTLDVEGIISSSALFWLGIVLVFFVIVLVALISPSSQETRDNKNERGNTA